MGEGEESNYLVIYPKGLVRKTVGFSVAAHHSKVGVESGWASGKLRSMRPFYKLFNGGPGSGIIGHVTPQEFTSTDHARNIMGILEDMKKNGLAKPGNLDKLARARSYLGISDAPAAEQAYPEELVRAQGAIDSFHRTMLLPMLQTPRPPSGVKRSQYDAKLGELQSHHETAKEILQDKTSTPKDREERVKGILMHGRQIYS